MSVAQLAPFFVGRRVKVRLGGRWVPADVAERTDDTVTVRVGSYVTSFVHVHVSVLRRDLRVA